MARIKIKDLPRSTVISKEELEAVSGGLTSFQAQVVDALNAMDARNEDLLDQAIDAANEQMTPDSNVTSDGASSPTHRRILWRRRFP